MALDARTLNLLAAAGHVAPYSHLRLPGSRSFTLFSLLVDFLIGDSSETARLFCESLVRAESPGLVICVPREMCLRSSMPTQQARAIPDPMS